MSCRLQEAKIYTNPNAQLSSKTFGRINPLSEDSHRNEYQRDIHRIIYCQSFRRLRHKTQVFFKPNNDHISTRLEHVLHVSSASRSVARRLGFNEDLTEAIGLAHDIGHAPYGHHGEFVLNTLSGEHKLGIRFEHELYGLRVVDKIAELDRNPIAGLNLTYEVREGIVAHCGEDSDREVFPAFKNRRPIDLGVMTSRKDLIAPSTYEAAIVRLVDKIVWAARDVEDAIHAELIVESDIPNAIKKSLGINNGAIIETLLNDLVSYSSEYTDRIGMSEDCFSALQELVDFNNENIYKNEKVELFKKQITRAIRQLFLCLLDDLNNTSRLQNGDSTMALPKASVYGVLDTFIRKVGYGDDDKNELIVLDFIAGMTDNYVIRCLDEIFTPKEIV